MPYLNYRYAFDFLTGVAFPKMDESSTFIPWFNGSVIENDTTTTLTPTSETVNNTSEISNGTDSVYVSTTSMIFLQTTAAQGIAGAMTFIAILITGFQVRTLPAIEHDIRFHKLQMQDNSCKFIWDLAISNVIMIHLRKQVSLSIGSKKQRLTIERSEIKSLSDQKFGLGFLCPLAISDMMSTLSVLR